MSFGCRGFDAHHGYTTFVVINWSLNWKQKYSYLKGCQCQELARNSHGRQALVTIVVTDACSTIIMELLFSSKVTQEDASNISLHDSIRRATLTKGFWPTVDPLLANSSLVLHKNSTDRKFIGSRCYSIKLQIDCSASHETNWKCCISTRKKNYLKHLPVIH